MMYNVPQFIDVEDKVAGPLTWRQLGWMIAMGVIVLFAFMMIGGAIAFVISVPTVLLFVALAFYRPNGMPLIAYFLNFFVYLFRPKVMMWDRPVNPAPAAPSRPVETTHPKQSKPVTEEDIHRLAEMIDSAK